MKKIFAVLVSILLMLGTAACTGKSAEDVKTYRIGLCNWVDDASLNQIAQNIQNRLTAIGTDKNVRFQVSYDNCNADSNVLSQIIANYISEGLDMMVGIATPVAMAMQAATADNAMPVVFSAVSDPLATGLVENMDCPGGNITGTSDGLNTTSVMNLMLAVDPSVKKIGLLYDVGQDSSKTSIATAKAFLDSKNIAYIERTGTTADEVVLAAQALVADDVDAVFTPTDNTIMNAQLSLYEVLAKAGIPHYAGADSFALNGAFIGYGVDYADLGVSTADMIADILLNNKIIGSVPVLTFDNETATINTEICQQLGYEYDTVAAAIKPFCSNIKTVTTAESFDDPAA